MNGYTNCRELGQASSSRRPDSDDLCRTHVGSNILWQRVNIRGQCDLMRFERRQVLGTGWRFPSELTGFCTRRLGDWISGTPVVGAYCAKEVRLAAF